MISPDAYLNVTTEITKQNSGITYQGHTYKIQTNYQRVYARKDLLFLYSSHYLMGLVEVVVLTKDGKPLTVEHVGQEALRMSAQEMLAHTEESLADWDRYLKDVTGVA